MVRGPGLLLRLFATLVIVLVLALACATWFFFRRPLLLDEGMSRLALGQVGLSRREVTSPLGPQTVFVGGSGSPLVLVHGEGDQAGAWARIMTPLVETRRVVVPDLAGHGGSAPDEGPLSVDVLVEGLQAVVAETCGTEPVVLVGHSLGALVAFTFAEENPQRVARLVAVNGGPISSSATEVPLRPRDRDDARAMMEALMGSPADAIPGHVLGDIVRRAQNGPGSRLQQTAVAMGRFAMDDRLNELEVPVSLIWGEADELFDVSYARTLSSLLPKCDLELLEGCGHWPQRECPVQTAEALEAVLP